MDFSRGNRCRIPARSYQRRRQDCRPKIGTSDLFLFKAALGHRIHLHLRAHGTAKLRATNARRNDSPDRIRTPEVYDLCRCAHFVAATPRIGVADFYVGRSVHQNILRRCRLGEYPLVGSDRLLFRTNARIITAAWRLRTDLPTKVITPADLTGSGVGLFPVRDPHGDLLYTTGMRPSNEIRVRPRLLRSAPNSSFGDVSKT